MKEIPLTWQMAREICMCHMRRCLRLTMIITVIVCAIAILIRKLCGFSTNYWFFLEYRYEILWLEVVIYSLPVNIYVTKNLLKESFTNFRIMILEKKPILEESQPLLGDMDL